MTSLHGDVSYPSGSKTMPAYLALPEGDGPFPALVIIHEIFGLNDNMRAIAGRFAEQGYAALAVDLFAGQNRAICMARFMADMNLNSLDHPGIRDLKTGLTWLAEQPYVDPERLGAVGFCMGGSFAIAWACTDQRLKAIAPFYGRNPRPEEAVRRMCPVVGSYPDPDFTTAAGKKLDEILDTCDVAHDIKIYKGAKHSFFNDTNHASYDPAASADAWQRILVFFREHIAGTPS
jgi:carboxymethylenebutenolidase